MKNFIVSVLLVLAPAPALAQTLYFDGVPQEKAISALASVGEMLVEVTPVWISGVGLPRTVSSAGDPFWVVGGFPGRPCRAGRVPFHQNFEEYATKAKNALVGLNLDEAGIYLDDLVAAIPCATEGFVPSELARVMMLRGIFAHWSGDAASARTLFRQAVVVLGHPEWDTDFGVDLEAVYNQAVAEVESEARIPIRYSLSQLSLSAFLIDGRDHLASLGEEVGGLTAMAGEHIIQWRVGDEPWQTRLFTVQNGAHLVSTEGLRQMLRRRPDDPDARLVQETLFGREKGVVTVVVWSKEEDAPAFIYIFDKNANRPVSYLVGAPRTTYASRHDVTNGPVAFTLAAGYLYYSTSFGTLAALGNFRLKGPFEIELGIEAALSGYGAVPWLLVSPRFGIRFQFRPERQVKPWVGVTGRVTFSDIAGAPPGRVGPLLAGGLEIPVWPTKRVGVSVSVAGGALFATHEPPVPVTSASIGLLLRESHWKK
jgi:hypothetical protein